MKILKNFPSLLNARLHLEPQEFFKA